MTFYLQKYFFSFNANKGAYILYYFKILQSNLILDKVSIIIYIYIYIHVIYIVLLLHNVCKAFFIFSKNIIFVLLKNIDSSNYILKE